MARLLVPFDFSPNAERALDQALYLAASNGASIEVLHITNSHVVKEYPKTWPHGEAASAFVKGELSKAVTARVAATKVAGLTLELVVKESVLITGGIISHVLETKPDLLVMGTHGLTGITDKWFGSNTSSLINHALFPIMAVPPAFTPAPLEKGIANIQLRELEAQLPKLEKWATFMGTPIEVIQFSALPAVDAPASVKPSAESRISITGILKTNDDLSLAENIAQFASAQQHAYCIMFVHERTWFEKIFDGSISEKVTGVIKVPLLALPHA